MEVIFSLDYIFYTYNLAIFSLDDYYLLMTQWTFFTNHGHILFIIALNKSAPVREIAARVGITERAALKILSDLARDEFIFIEKVGRNNIYTVNLDKHLRHDIERECTVGDVTKMLKKANTK